MCQIILTTVERYSMATEELRFDWFQPNDADFIEELVATVIDTASLKDLR